MRLEIARLHQKLGATMVYVTHDQVEAMTLADKIVVLQAGQIEQIGSPLDLYRHPGNLFVAQFIGSPKMNVVDCTGTGTSVTFGNDNTSDIARNAEGATKMGVRPEHMALCPEKDGILVGQIDVMEHLGSDSFAYVNVTDVGLFTVRIVGHSDAVVGDVVGLTFGSENVHLFDAAEKTIPA